MENTTDTHTNRVPLAAKVDPEIAVVIEGFAKEDERSISNTVERLLKTHPRIQPLLDAEAVAGA